MKVDSTPARLLAAAARLARQCRIAPLSVGAAAYGRLVRRPWLRRRGAALVHALSPVAGLRWPSLLLDCADPLPPWVVEALLDSDETLFGCAWKGDTEALLAADLRFALERCRLQALQPLLAEAWHGRLEAGQLARFQARIGRELTRAGDGGPSYPMDEALQAVSLLLLLHVVRAGRLALAPALQARALQRLASIVVRCDADPESSGRLSNNHHLTTVVLLWLVASSLGSEDSRQAAYVRAIAVRARRWAGRAIDAQFLPDGAHFEASSGYHMVCLELLGLAALAALEDERAAPASMAGAALRAAAAQYAPAIVQALVAAHRYASALRRPDGSWPTIGDFDASRAQRITGCYPSRATEMQAWTIHDVAGRKVLRQPLEKADGDAGIAWVARLFGFDAQAASGAAPQRPAHARPVARPVSARSNGDGGPVPRGGAAVSRGDRVPEEELAAVPAACAARLRHAQHWVRYAFALNGAGIERIEHFAHGGVLVFSGNGLHLVMRNGKPGQHGIGTHTHLDALALDVWLRDGVRIADPGSRVYGAWRAQRDAYRSAAAHFTPLWNLPTGASLLHPFALLGRPPVSTLDSVACCGWGTVDLEAGSVTRVVRQQGDRLLVLDVAEGIALAPYPFERGAEREPGYFGPIVKKSNEDGLADRHDATPDRSFGLDRS